MRNEKIFAMPFSDVYPLYVAKAERKQRSQQEVDEIITWLTGYSESQIKEQVALKTSFEDFFKQAPKINENVNLITGKVCGIRVEEIEDPFMQQIRYLDKLIDELAKNRKMEKILRK